MDQLPPPPPAIEQPATNPFFQRSPTEAMLKELIGMSEAQAETWVKERKLTLRVLTRDRIGFPATMDFRVDRVNLDLEDGKVVKASGG